MGIFLHSRWQVFSVLDFKISKFYWLMGSRELRCITVANFVKTGQSVVEILTFGQLPSGICMALNWTIHKQ